MANSVSRLDVAINNMRSLGATALDPNRLQRYIEKAMLSMVKDALMKSYHQSGVKTGKGRIERALNGVDVKIQKGKLRISMNAGDAILTQASSVNYGAVRNSGGLGKRAKKTLKAAVFGNRALTEREMRRYTKGVNQIHDGRIVKRGSMHGKSEAEVREMLRGKLGGNRSIGGATFVKPHPFFFISASDKKRIYTKFEELYQAFLNGTLKRPSPGGA